MDILVIDEYFKKYENSPKTSLQIFILDILLKLQPNRTNYTENVFTRKIYLKLKYFTKALLVTKSMPVISILWMCIKINMKQYHFKFTSSLSCGTVDIPN